MNIRPSRTTLILIAVVGALLEVQILAVRAALTQFHGVVPGMSREEVVRRLGPPSRAGKDGVTVSGTALYYQVGVWPVTDRTLVVVLAGNDRVVSGFVLGPRGVPPGGIEVPGAKAPAVKGGSPARSVLGTRRPADPP